MLQVIKLPGSSKALFDCSQKPRFIFCSVFFFPEEIVHIEQLYIKSVRRVVAGCTCLMEYIYFFNCQNVAVSYLDLFCICKSAIC